MNSVNIASFVDYYNSHLGRWEERETNEAPERIAFSQEFPVESIKTMSVEDYAVGRGGDKHNLCYQLEFGKYKHTGMGIGGATSKKYGLYFNKAENNYKYQNDVIDDINGFWPKFRNQLYEFLKKCEDSSAAPSVENYPLLKGMGMVLTKLLHLYYPDSYISLASRSTLEALMEHFGYSHGSDMEAYSLNYELRKNLKRDFPETSHAGGTIVGTALWNYYKEVIKDNDAVEWTPPLSEYNPGLTEEDWYKLLQDDSVFTRGSLEIMKRMKDHGGEATCTQLEQKYGELNNFYNKGSSALAKRVAEKTGCPVTTRNNGNSKWWPVLYMGRHARENEAGSWVWRLRDELSAALDRMDLSDVELYSSTTSHTESISVESESEPRYWVYRIEDIDTWSDFLDMGVVSIEIEGVGDYRDTYQLKGASAGKKTPAAKKIEFAKDKFPKETPTEKMSLAYTFCETVQVDDVIYTTDLDGSVLGRGVIQSEYEYQEKDNRYHHTRRVDWSTRDDVNVTLTDLQNDFGELYEPAPIIRLEEAFRPSLDIRSEGNFNDASTTRITVYTESDFFNQVYMSKEQFRMMSSILEHKKNVILQGPPGVGKTFAAKRIAYAIMGETDDSRIEFVQFHQNYAYEDFVMGYKPSEDGFEMRYGIFYRFCKKAALSKKKHFFIIDEINRGKLSKIFGELLMLIEDDHRGDSVVLAYDGEGFSVPPNLYIIGMMNTADRGLALIDYALRRRFSFVDITPGFDREGFKKYQEGINNTSFNRLVEEIKQLNKFIEDDESLGEGFSIGHSYLCKLNRESCTKERLDEIVRYDILPTLKEYWFDNKSNFVTWEERLLRSIQ